MTYIIGKPDTGKAPNIDAPTIQGNFAAFQAALSTNHLALNAFNEGYHKAVIFQNQTKPSNSPISACFLFSANATSNIDTQPQLYVKIPKFLPTREDSTVSNNLSMQLTYNQVNTVGPSQYQSFLVGGYLIYFGTITGTTTPNVIISRLITLSPVPTEILMAIATPNTMTTFSPIRPFDVKTIIEANLTTFTISSVGQGSHSSIAYSFGWVAIAKA